MSWQVAGTGKKFPPPCKTYLLEDQAVGFRQSGRPRASVLERPGA
jgi:hypothetical protein